MLIIDKLSTSHNNSHSFVLNINEAIDSLDRDISEGPERFPVKDGRHGGG
jgi:hypothetical protein